MEIIEAFDLQARLPSSIAEHFKQGMNGEVSDNPKADDPCFSNIEHIILAKNETAVDACHEAASKYLGFQVIRINSSITGLVEDAARDFVGQIDKWLPSKKGETVCVLAGGETVVEVHGTGKGGRNQELALRVARQMHVNLPDEWKKAYEIVFLSGGTDGQDGPTPAAGAVVDTTTWDAARQANLDPEGALDDNDSFTFFEQLQHGEFLLTPGLTGTNVMDVMMLLLRFKSA
eukprot:m.143570 g.143570  ORF g.143570 m.143570 type:complete len:232 (-) comp16020_c2_seq2:378-1073(-)